MYRSRTINTIGACFTGVVLVIVLISKFASGAWIVVVAMPVIWLTMRGIHKHYEHVRVELTPPDDYRLTLPARNRSIVLVSKLHLPTLRALAYAKATHPSQLEAVTVDVDEAETLRLKEDWERASIPVPLTVIASPVPGDHPAHRGLREAAAPGEPAGHRHRVRPGIRGRALVGAAAAQPERAPAEDPAADAARGDRGQRALPAALGGHRIRRAPRRAGQLDGPHAGGGGRDAAAAAADRRPGHAARARSAGRVPRRGQPPRSRTPTLTSTSTWRARCARSPCGRAAPA